MKEEKSTAWSLFVIVASICSWPWHAYVLAMLWQWFMTPLGVVSISVAHAIGIISITKLIVQAPLRVKDDGWSEKERNVYGLLVAFLTPVIALAAGFVAKSLM